jgi:hypothetical protein
METFVNKTDTKKQHKGEKRKIYVSPDVDFYSFLLLLTHSHFYLFTSIIFESLLTLIQPKKKNFRLYSWSTK